MKRRHLSSLLYFLTGGLQMRDVQCHCAGQRRGLQASFVLQFKEIYIERTSIFVSSKEGNFFSCLKIYFQMDFFLRKTVSFSKQCFFFLVLHVSRISQIYEIRSLVNIIYELRQSLHRCHRFRSNILYTEHTERIGRFS